VNRLRKLARLQRAERDLLCRALFAVLVARLALWVLPFKQLRSRLDHRLRPIPSEPVERLVWAVRNAARLIPFATCLTQSLALYRLLARAGYPSRIQIGVAKDPETGFQAHAWVEHDGSPLLSTHFPAHPLLASVSGGDPRVSVIAGAAEGGAAGRPAAGMRE
jgi:Transglutaminase-like superfamily